jgi:hypothetical protein
VRLAQLPLFLLDLSLCFLFFCPATRLVRVPPLRLLLRFAQPRLGR